MLPSALAVEEGQRIRQLAEVVVFIVSHAAHKTGDNAHEDAHGTYVYKQ